MPTTLAQRLAALLDDHAMLPDVLVHDRPPARAADGSPPAAGTWTPQERGAFAGRLLRDINIATGQHPGITRSRLRGLLPDHRKAQVEQVLQWLEAAQVLAPPITPLLPFRHPRRLVCTRLVELLNRLNATPHPMCNADPSAQPHILVREEAPPPP